MSFLAAALCDVYFILLVGTLLDGDLNIQIVRCSKPGTASRVKYGVKCLMKEIVERLR
jgi:hypothetical protein